MHGDLKITVLCCLVACSAGRALGEPALQPVDSIRAAAAQHVRQAMPPTSAAVFVAADKLDSRLRLPQCGAALESFLPSGANLGSRATVGVRCQQGAMWTVYVPVNIETEVQVLVLRRAVSQDSAISSQDVELQTRRFKGPSSKYLTDVSQLRGMRAKRSLPVGSILVVDGLAPDVLVKRGQQVVLLATVGGIEVRASGIALTDGGAASRVRVQNSSSSKVVEGTVTADSTVRVAL